MRRRALLLIAVAIASAPVIGGVSAAPAHAGCTDEYCDPPPHPMQQPVYLEWGCGTVTVHAFNKYEHTVDFGLCPGPMP